jgi:hypothetical protein
MTMNHLSDQALLSETQRLCALERKATIEILRHLQEIEVRALYAKTHSSLFEFCVKALGFSEDQAARRISSMRLLRSVPEVEAKVASGELKLNQLAQVQTFTRAEKKEAGRQVSKEEAQSLLLELSGKSSRETEKVLLEKSPALQAKRATEERMRPVTQTHVEIKFVADPELIALLERAKGLLAHNQEMNPSLASIMKKSLQALLAQKAKERGIKLASPRLTPSEPATRGLTHDLPAASHVQGKPLQRSVGTWVKRQIFQKAKGQCEYIYLNGTRCKSRHALEVHHVVPFARGGSNTSDNLRLYCRTHNAAQGKWDFPRVTHYQTRNTPAPA